MRWRNLFAFLALAFATACNSWADREFKLLERTLDSDAVEVMRLDIRVGDAEVTASADDKIHVAVKVYGARGWFGRRSSVPEGVELKVRQRSNYVQLALDDDNFEEEWTIQIPARLALDVDFGVGDIEISGLTGDITLDLGVGDARIRGLAEHYSSVYGDVGVGDGHGGRVPSHGVGGVDLPGDRGVVDDRPGAKVQVDRASGRRFDMGIG